jgi:hypothetical protein
VRAAAIARASAALLVVALAPVPAGAAPARPDFGGIWEHSVSSRPRRDPPPWTPLAQQLLKEDQEQRWHNGVSEENTYCLPAGMPFMMSGSEGFDLVQGSHEIAIINEERPSPRHIYLDGRKHPDLANYDPTTVGHSIGRWEGDVLVVDTIGFRPGATVQFVRGPQTHLVERYHLENGGKTLRIDFTWEDPQLLSKPWSYTYLMERAPPDRDALEYYCDPRDPARAQP